MIVGSIKENTTLEKRVSLTPESAKNIIGLGLKVCVEKGYALHLGINDSEYNNLSVSAWFDHEFFMSFGMKEFTVNFKDCTIIHEMKEFMPDGMRM